MNDFASRLLDWFAMAGRCDLPWQANPTPYRVWISEIMLQQTQVRTVIPYYEKFIKRFPKVQDLAEASLDDVLHLWSGLGYYARARNLHRAAGIVIKDYQGEFPSDITELVQLPGIGRSTAGAILSLSMGKRHPILDGNVKRVLTRHQGIVGWPGKKKIEDRLWNIAEQFTPAVEVAEYTQAIMDLGATLCTRSKPQCEHCPLAGDCYAFQHDEQSSYPSRRAKKAIAVKKTIFTIIKNDRGEVLLERRPPAGIWGGLWSFPECPVDESVALWVETQFGSKVYELEEKQQIRHTFSHFHLDILPVHVQLTSNGNAVKDNGEIYWYKPEYSLQRGIAAPVAKLLQGI